MTVSATQSKRGQSRNRNEYHRLRYNNLSAKKKAERSKQVRKSLENKISNLDSTELIQYKELKKQRDSKYYYNKKVKSLMKDLQEMNLNAVPSISSTVFGTRRSIVHVPEYINGLYRSIGNNILPGGCSGCYGEITKGSFHKICIFLLKYGLAKPKNTISLDCGSGFGKPSFHMAGYFQSLSIGIELDPNLWLCSINNLTKIMARFKQMAPPVAFIEEDMLRVKSLEGIDLLYSFDCLFPPFLRRHMAMLFNESSTTRVLVSYCSQSTLEDAGYQHLTLKGKVTVSMCGSKESKTAFIFKKHITPARSNDADDLFQRAIGLYHDGTLNEANAAIDVTSYCNTPMKLRHK